MFFLVADIVAEDPVVGDLGWTSRWEAIRESSCNYGVIENKIVKHWIDELLEIHCAGFRLHF
jgi:hypothetical protein